MPTPTSERPIPTACRQLGRCESKAKAMTGITTGMVAMISTPLIAVVVCRPV